MNTQIRKATLTDAPAMEDESALHFCHAPGLVDEAIYLEKRFETGKAG